jgi:oleate hydratase
MGSLPQHSVMEFRRYINRALPLFPHLYDMTHILRTPLNQHQAFIDPLVGWLRPRGVGLQTGAFVQDIGFAPSPGRITVNRLDIDRSPTFRRDRCPRRPGRRAATDGLSRCGRVWRRGVRFWNPDVFFDAAKAADSRWVTFTVTTTGTEFLEQMKKLTGSETGSGGVVTLRDSGWLLSVTIFHRPEVICQPTDT